MVLTPQWTGVAKHVKHKRGVTAINIGLDTFDSVIGWLEFVVDHPDFRDEDWTSATPLFPVHFAPQLTAWEAKEPGVSQEFKLAFQFVLNTWDDQRLESFWRRRMDFGLPDPPMRFLKFVWEAIYPGEPWQRTFPDEVRVIPSWESVPPDPASCPIPNCGRETR